MSIPRLPSLLLACALLDAAALADTPAVSRLGQGINSFRAQNYPGAAQQLAGLQSQLPKLTDYIAYHLGSAEEQTGDVDGAIRDLSAYRANPVSGSPLGGKISLLLAKSLLDKKQPASTSQAVQVLENDFKTLPEPDGDALLAMAYEAQGEAPQAALVYERIYYSFPNTSQAADAWNAMERLRNAIGPNFPKPTAKQQLERCEKWLAAREYFKARLEYDSLAKSLPEPERDEAKVGVGAAQYLSGDDYGAISYLRGLRVAKSEADARRLYYLTEAARKTGDDAEMMSAIKTLNDRYGKSVWRLKALVTAGNRYLLTNDREKYAPLFRAASDTFPEDNSTAYCHWKFTWDGYLAGRGDAAGYLREQVERYPGDVRASSALYFLGRLSEQRGALGEARTLYEQLSARYPHYFYAVLARRRLADAKLSGAAAEGAEWLANVQWAPRRDLSATEPNAATQLRIDRAKLLMAAGLPDMAEAEFRYGSKLDGEQVQLLSIEMARTAESPFRALRVMKSFSSDYLSLPIEGASRKFWEMLFPLPYKEEVFRFARSKNLDPYFVAALIRQESEFNPGALSHARAYGLMQLIPSTGRMVGRQEGVSVPSAASLFNPVLNLRLGTHYLRGQLDTWGGNLEETLAAYNAGPGRVREWLTWSNYREPAEFVENIPFTETREYVQAVLRNADMYRQIYGTGRAQTAPELLTSNAFSSTGKSGLTIPEYGAKPATLVAGSPVTSLAGSSAGSRALVKMGVAPSRAKKALAVHKPGSGRSATAHLASKPAAGKKSKVIFGAGRSRRKHA